MKIGNGSLKQENEYFYECKDICESDSFCGLIGGVKEVAPDAEWRLMFASNIEINVNRKDKIANPPRYFIFFAIYSDKTYDVVRFDIKNPKYITGYNESRKLYKDELKWIIECLNNNYNWEYFLDDYNDAVHFEDSENEYWEMPNYNLLETED